MSKLVVCVLVLGCLALGATCRHKIIEDSSAFALAAGEPTMILGGCQRPLTKGYDSCQIRENSQLPKLQMAFTSPAEYAISDCRLGIFHTGSVDQPGMVEVDLAPLDAQIKEDGFCILRVEAIERYPDPRDKNQLREIPLAGGWFIEVLDPDYIPSPPDQLVSWCYKVRRTNKGRTTVEDCR